MTEPEAPFRIRRRIGKKLAMWVGASALALGAILLMILLPAERSAVEKTAADQVGLLAEAVAASFAVVDERARTHHADVVIAQVAAAPNVAYVDVLDHRGAVKQSSRSENVGIVRKVPSRLRDVRIDDELLVVSTTLPWTQGCVGCHDAASDPVGVVEVTVSRRAALASLERFHMLGGLGVLALFAALVVVVLVLTERFVSRPIFALARVMSKAERGDFFVRGRHFADDELGALVRTFNSMLKNIVALKATEIEREEDLRRAQEELSLKAQLQETADQLKDTNHALEKRVKAQEVLMEAAHRLGSTLDHDAVLDRLTDIVAIKLAHPDFAIFIVQESDGDALLHVVRASGITDTPRFRAATFAIGHGITGLVAETGAPLSISDARATEHTGIEMDLLEKNGSLLSIPMLHKGRVVGVIDFFHEECGAFADEDAVLLQALAAQAAMAVVNADLYEKTLELSVTDALTGLMNRRALETRLAHEVLRAQRFSMPLCVLMIDVDHFKTYNDRMGHLLGDEALKAVASTLEKSVRKVDAVARFGGEEFCVFLPRTDQAAGLDVAEKLRVQMHTIDVPGAETQPMGHLSISVGLAVFPNDMPAGVDGSLAKVLLDRADRAVYEAKRHGRDRIMTAAQVFGVERPPLEVPDVKGVAP
jgi:diguanylate cyclase (GGDEF)-like protein